MELGQYGQSGEALDDSAEAGYDKSSEAIQTCFVNGDVTIDDFEKALQAYRSERSNEKRA